MLLQDQATQKCNCGLVNKIETFGLVDGPGVRFVVFMQGCNMRCRYCHNPETWALSNKEAKLYSPSDLLNQALKYKDYWGKNLKNGGITVSGGEPLLQLDFLIEFFRLAKQKGIHTCIDSCGEPFKNTKEYTDKLDELLKYTDLFLVDIKAFDDDLHKSLTGKSNASIKAFVNYLSKKGISMWIRRVIVPELTDGEEDLINTSNFIKSLKTVKKVEVLPYHTLGAYKYKQLKIKYTLDGVDTPSKADVLKAQKLLDVNSYKNK